VKFWIDEPTEPSVARAAVCIRGWCYDESGRTVRGVRALLRGRAIAGLTDGHRPDVRETLAGPPASEWSGFTIAVRLSPGKNPIRLEADVAGLGWTKFHDLVLSAPWWADAGHWWRMARFGIEAVLGGGAALGRLTQKEQDFIFAKIEQYGGHPLRTSPHYPPRTPVAERFPRPRLRSAQLPKVVVVTPSFQQGSFIEATLRSVIEQEGARVDYIVQDGGSTDGTADLLRRYAPRLTAWASEPDQGQNAGRTT
jgi:hypothetical protein